MERFENGVRILFRPLGSSYSSKSDERNSEKKEEVMQVKKTASPQVPKIIGYLSPEQEKAEEERAEREKVKARLLEEDKKMTAAAAAVPKKGSSIVKLEGGLEIIIESLPYRRVRIKRCNMGALTVVKEESEALLIRSILKGLQVLENDYRVALMTSFKP